MTVLMFFATIVAVAFGAWAVVWLLAKVAHPPILDSIIWALAIVLILTLVVTTLWPGVVDLRVPHF